MGSVTKDIADSENYCNSQCEAETFSSKEEAQVVADEIVKALEGHGYNESDFGVSVEECDLTALELIEFLLQESAYKDSWKYWQHDYPREGTMTQMAQALVDYAFSGTTSCSFGKERISRIFNLIKDDEERKEIAELLIDANNYTRFEPDYNDLGQGEERERVLRDAMEDYDGLDAYIFAARLEFAENLKQDYADVGDLIKLFSE